MNNHFSFIKKSYINIVVLLSFLIPVFAEESNTDHEGDWFSENELASIVKLSSILEIYEVEGLSDDYSYRTKGDKPDFGDAQIVSYQRKLVHVGTGVVVTESGLILSNAHVTRAYSKPKIMSNVGPDDHPKKGPNGKLVKYVIVNLNDQLMVVGMADKEKLAQGDDSQKPLYLAFVATEDQDYDTRVRDRAILQIFGGNLELEDGVPKKYSDIEEISLPFAKCGNPFRLSLTDRKVRAMGFPGTGDPNRAARTSGEIIGYENEDRSVILHTSYISNGNSGGGLFHKGNLIGINTWDNQENPSRPLGCAQPITYWYDMFVKASFFYSQCDIPDVELGWLESDPSTESYKMNVLIKLQIVSESDQNKAVTGGYVFVHRLGTTIEDIFEYRKIAKELNIAWNIVRYSKYYSVDEIVEATGYSYLFVDMLRSITDREQLRALVNKSNQKYFDEWMSDKFLYIAEKVEDSEGKVVLSVPQDCKYELTYVADNLKYKKFSLTAGLKYSQGPFMITVSE